MNICRNCVYFQDKKFRFSVGLSCRHPRVMKKEICVVTGDAYEVTVYGSDSPWKLRSIEKACGPKGVWFREKNLTVIEGSK
jgi:hypothetical protein